MADRVVDPEQEAPEPDELLLKLLQYIVNEARTKLEEEHDLAPFVGIAVKDSLILEEVVGEEPDELYRMAKHTVEHVRGASAYGFVYDGYVDTDDGRRDAIIAEGGMAGQPEGYAVGLLYAMDKEAGTFEFEPPITYIGLAPNFMALLVNDSVSDGGEEAVDSEEASAQGTAGTPAEGE